MANAVVSFFFVVVQVVWWPISKVISAFQIILSPVLYAAVVLLCPIWMVSRFLLLPIVHVTKGLFHITTFPLQVKWLERIETLYIYLGTAGLIGCMTGGFLYFIFKFLSSSLSIYDTPKATPPRGRTTADFRSAQRRKQDPSLAPASPIQVVTDSAPGSRRRRSLLSQTIVEEEDSDF